MTTDIYISNGYIIEELLRDGTQIVIIRKATTKDYEALDKKKYPEKLHQS